MLTRGHVTAQYDHRPGAAPPQHAAGHEHQEHVPMSRARLYGAGGLMGGAVTLTARGWVGARVGDTGYGYLGMDPSAPGTWPRPFNPAPGMISFLNWPSAGTAAPVSEWRWLENG
jgi:hypothetical protein